MAARVESMVEHEEHRVYSVSLEDNVFPVTVTASHTVASRWVEEARSGKRGVGCGDMTVGLGIRWSPISYMRNRVPSTLLLCWGDHSLIFQIARSEFVPYRSEFRKFLMSPGLIFVGFWNVYHRHLLAKSNQALILGRDPIDLRVTTEELEINDNLGNLASYCLGVEGVENTVEVDYSDWGTAILSNQQILQAFLEVRCAYLIGHGFFYDLP